ncbi:hypothetical protein BGX29_001775 [Mortierella sp. GBA35]|nr:hypothetical protein BGX29_001775 [Mortierella sp. GBA35]
MSMSNQPSAESMERPDAFCRPPVELLKNLVRDRSDLSIVSCDGVLSAALIPHDYSPNLAQNTEETGTKFKETRIQEPR